MKPGTIALIVVAVSVAAWGLFMFGVTVRRQRKAAFAVAGAGGTTEAPPRPSTPAEDKPEDSKEVTVRKVPPKERKPLSPEALAVSRRQFLNRAWTASFSAFLGFFGMASLSFLWPKLTGGFGTKIKVGALDDLVKEVGPENGYLPKFVPEGRFWLTAYEGTGDSPVYTAINAKETGLLALYRKCVHLGCSVPHCQTSMLFECPCHGSKYRLNGEYFGGPAPRGLDRFPLEVQGGQVTVDTGKIELGPPRGIDTWSKFSEPQGSFCVPT